METPIKRKSASLPRWVLFLICLASITICVTLLVTSNQNIKSINEQEKISKLSKVEIEDFINNKAYINIYGNPGSNYACVAVTHLRDSIRIGRTVATGEIGANGEAKEEIGNLSYYKLTSFICQPETSISIKDSESLLNKEHITTEAAVVTALPTSPKLVEQVSKNNFLKIKFETRLDQSLLCTLYNRYLVNYKEVPIVSNNLELFETSFNLYLPKITGEHAESSIKSELFVKYSDGIETSDLLEGVQSSENPVTALEKHTRHVSFVFKNLSSATYTLKCFTTSASNFTDLSKLHPSSILQTPLEKTIKIDSNETYTDNIEKQKIQLLGNFLQIYEERKNNGNKEHYKELYKFKHILNAISEFKEEQSKHLMLKELIELNPERLYSLINQHGFVKHLVYFSRNIHKLSSLTHYENTANNGDKTKNEQKHSNIVKKQIHMFLNDVHFRNMLLLSEYNDKLQRSFMSLLDPSLTFRVKIFLYEVKELINTFIVLEDEEEIGNSKDFEIVENMDKLYYSLEYTMRHFVEYFFNLENSFNMVKLNKLKRFNKKFLGEDEGDVKIGINKEEMNDKIRKLDFVGLKEVITRFVKGNYSDSDNIGDKEGNEEETEEFFDIENDDGNK